MTIGDRIKQARTRPEAGLTQQQLGERIGVSRAAVSQWERGDTKDLKLHNLFHCARALGVSAVWLALNEGSMDATTEPTPRPSSFSVSEKRVDYRFASYSQVARDLADDILKASADDRIDDRVLDSLLHLVRELARTPRPKRIRDSTEGEGSDDVD